MDNTIELQALKTSVQQLGGDVANLLVQRNVAVAQVQAAQSALVEETKRREVLETKVKELTAENELLKNHLSESESDFARAESKRWELEDRIDGATAFMTAENALAFTTGGDPVEPSATEPAL